MHSGFGGGWCDSAASLTDLAPELGLQATQIGCGSDRAAGAGVGGCCTGLAVAVGAGGCTDCTGVVGDYDFLVADGNALADGYSAKEDRDTLMAVEVAAALAAVDSQRHVNSNLTYLNLTCLRLGSVALAPHTGPC